MARVYSWLGVSILSFAAVGCVSQEKYSALKMEADQTALQLQAVEREKAEAVAGRDLLQRQLDRLAAGGDQTAALISNQSTQLADLQRRYDELNERYVKALGNVGQAVVLSAPLNEALKQFAAQNPDIVDFDETRGMLKFKSDVTFSPGSAVLTASASSVIDRFATIVNSAAAAGYELMVVGHTDNVRVAHDATIKAGHFNNWYLSAHRAISVSAELQKQGVSPGRLEVAGCAEQRPIASNATEAGKAMNRRVEVLILPTTASRPAVAAAPTAPVAMKAAAKVIKPELNKDANKDVPEPRKVGLNK